MSQRTKTSARPWEASLLQTILKAQPSSSSAHVPVPLGSDKKPKPDTDLPLQVNSEIDVLKGIFDADSQDQKSVVESETRLALEAMALDEEASDAMSTEQRDSDEEGERAVASLAVGASGGPEPSAPGAPSRPVRSTPDVPNQASTGPTVGDSVSGDIQVLGSIFAARAGDDKDNVVQKSAGTTKRVPILKINKKRQIVTGVVLEPEAVDVQSDILFAEDIEKTAHAYLENSRQIKNSHEGKVLNASVVESYIAPADFFCPDESYGSQDIKKGSWILSVRIQDPKIWAMVENGELNGFSVGGQGLRDKLV